MEVYYQKTGKERLEKRMDNSTTQVVQVDQCLSSQTSEKKVPAKKKEEPALMMYAYAIKKVAKKEQGKFDWNVYRIEIYEDDTFKVKIEKSCINKGEAVANYQRLNAAEVLFGKTL